jgi:hypothetical protein
MPIVWAAQAAGLAYTAVSKHLGDEEIAFIINIYPRNILVQGI